MSGEYKYWINIFKNKKFQDNLMKISAQLLHKKVLLYCCGAYFDALTDCFDFEKIFDVIGVSDLKFEKVPTENYKTFKSFKPTEVKNLDFEYIIITSPNAENVGKILRKEQVISENIKEISINLKEDDSQELVKNYKKKLEEIRKKDKIRVVFMLEENTKWSYQLLYEKLVKDEKFEVLPVVLFPIVTKNRVEYTQKENLEFLRKLNVPAVDYYDYKNEENKNIKYLEPDIVFYSQPWYLMNVNHPKIVSEYALTCLVPYGYTTLSGSEWGSSSVKEVYRSMWRFFSESEYHNTFYEQTCNMKKNLFAIGSLKFDYYKIPVNSQVNKLWKGEEQKARIIYAPHHSLKNNWIRMSNFDRDYRFFLELAKNNPQYSFIFKPHPALRAMCGFEKLMTEVEYDNYIEEWNSLENACCYNKGNYFDIFKSSDCLITDCSSFLAEYYPSGKPLIFLDRKDRAPFDDFGEKISKGFYKMFDTQELPQLLKTLLIEKNDFQQQIRKEILEKYFYIPDKMSCDIIADYIKNA